MMKKLDELIVGETGLIKSIEGEGKIRRRLFDMGVTPGASVYLRKKAPLGDPLQIEVRGYSLSIRKEIASKIEVEVILWY